MKRLLFLLLACLTMALGMTSCRMRYPQGTSYKIYKDNPSKTKRHYGARRNYKNRREVWGRKHYGPRPYRHRGRYRY